MSSLSWQRFLVLTERLIWTADRKETILLQNTKDVQDRIKYLEDRIKTLETITKKSPKPIKRRIKRIKKSTGIIKKKPVNRRTSDKVVKKRSRRTAKRRYIKKR